MVFATTLLHWMGGPNGGTGWVDSIESQDRPTKLTDGVDGGDRRTGWTDRMDRQNRQTRWRRQTGRMDRHDGQTGVCLDYRIYPYGNFLN